MKTIYLFKAENEDLYKIGITKNIEERLKGVQTGCPYKVTIFATFNTQFNETLETTLHRNYNLKNTNGEWFKLSLQEANDFIKTCEKFESNFKFLKESGNKFIK